MTRTIIGLVICLVGFAITMTGVGAIPGVIICAIGYGIGDFKRA